MELIFTILAILLACFGVYRVFTGDILWGVVSIVLAIVVGVFIL